MQRTHGQIKRGYATKRCGLNHPFVRPVRISYKTPSFKSQNRFLLENHTAKLELNGAEKYNIKSIHRIAALSLRHGEKEFSDEF